MTCRHNYCRGRCIYCGMVKLLEMENVKMCEPTQSIIDFDTGIEIVLRGVVPGGFVLTTPTRRFVYSAENDMFRAERIGSGIGRHPRRDAPAADNHDEYLEGLTQTMHTKLVYGSVSPEFDRAAEIVKHMYEDPDGPLVPLPSKPQPVEQPFVPRKLGEF